MSQIGYMMLAAGLGPAGYAFAIFHLLTHGFFKANLFLGAGSVMHAMNDEVDMRRYGGLARILPITFVTFACGYLAIIGFPGFAGFFSKDKIIETAFGHDVWVGLIALIGAGITAFYMTRMMIMTYISEKRWAKDAHPHESPLVMTIPLMVLAVLSVTGGLLLLNDWIVDWLEPVFGPEPHEDLPIPALAISGLALVVVAIGAVIAWFSYGTKEIPAVAPQRVSVATKAARADLYGDAFNEAVFMRPGQYLTRSLVYFDNRGVDGAVNGLAALVGGTSGRIRRWQTGFVRSYALSMLAGCGAHRDGAAGGEAGMTGSEMSVPWLSILIALPLLGAVAVMLLPRGTALPKQAAFGVSLGRLGDLGRDGRRSSTPTTASSSSSIHEWISGVRCLVLGRASTDSGLVLVLLTTILTPVVILASWNDADDGRWSVNSFFAWMLALEGLASRRLRGHRRLLVLRACSRRR